jgi:hypothetical protein
MTNTASRVLALIVSVGVIVCGGCGPGTAPVEQPPMVVVNAQTLEKIREEFSRTAGQTRVVLLLSPT